MPSPRAAATLVSESSTKNVAAGSRPKRSSSSRKMAGSGLAIPSSPETSRPSNQSRNSKRGRVMAKVSADQLVRAYSGTPAARRSASTSTVPGMSPATISGQRSW